VLFARQPLEGVRQVAGVWTKLAARYGEAPEVRNHEDATTASGPELSLAPAAGSGVADSVQGILIHSIDDPAPG